MTLQEYATYAVPAGAPALPDGILDGPKAVENFLINTFQGCSAAESSLNEMNETRDNAYRWSINESGEFVGSFRTPINLAGVTAS
jgi:hypothetical protein